MEKPKTSKSALLKMFNANEHKFTSFRTSLEHQFLTDPSLNGEYPIVHSVKGRTKDSNHFYEKVLRKRKDGRVINDQNVFKEITDIAGLRVLYLYPQQFKALDLFIREQITNKEWILVEDPFAYTWDKDAEHFFDSLGYKTKFKESNYTSVHYVIKPNPSSSLSCEIQLRSLFEEIWGEIDHTINYPKKTKSIACTEQLKVMAKLIGAGGRLGDSIFRSHQENIKLIKKNKK